MRFIFPPINQHRLFVRNCRITVNSVFKYNKEEKMNSNEFGKYFLHKIKYVLDKLTLSINYHFIVPINNT